MNVLITYQEANGSIAAIDITVQPGVEPPRHTHQHEDETFIMQEGEVNFLIGEELIKARAGMTVFAPKGVEHSFAVKTPQARFLVMVTPG